ncbi:hypothetical protein [Pseudonocardia sp. TRM90224]|uniref:hypothetical protein n=1 Tax=Pseudonocardia sp. TRM90224 TaxID=2812678 RepID=UPI001E33EF0C|nr:hypothetical protein [Pseudonocardia sp. TRM90224]
MMTAPQFPSYPTTAVSRPPGVTIAFVLYLVSGVLAAAFVVLGAVQSLANPLPTTDLASAGLTPEQVEQAETFVRISQIIGSVIIMCVVAFLVVAAFLMRAGQNWARILLTIVSGLAALLITVGLVLLPGLRSVAGTFDLIFLVMIVGQVVAYVVAIFLMFRPAANAFFRRR